MSEELKPFQKVLVRHRENQAWSTGFFSHEQHSEDRLRYVCGGQAWNYCIPYEGNEHLLGTTDSPTPPEPEFKWGDHVEVRNDENEQWRKAVFCSIGQHNYFYCLIEPSGCCLWALCRHANW